MPYARCLMKSFIKESERIILSALISGSNCPSIEVPQKNCEVDVDYSGAGYFLTYRSNNLPTKRYVLDTPKIHGWYGKTQVGFIAFVEDSEIMLECYTFTGDFSPEDRECEYRADSA